MRFIISSVFLESDSKACVKVTEGLATINSEPFCSVFFFVESQIDSEKRLHNVYLSLRLLLRTLGEMLTLFNSKHMLLTENKRQQEEYNKHNCYCGYYATERA